jgi:Lipopolysaccharide export system permease LptF/LptG
MRQPGTRLRAFAARLCCARTMERLVDPTIGDLQTEYEHAVSTGRKWESRRIWVLGHLALARAMAVHACLRATAILLDSRDDDHRPVRRTVLASSAIMALGTVILMLPFLDDMRSHPHPTEIALYLVPQALPLSIPIGLTFGILWGLGRVAASYRSRTVILSLAVVASLISFTMLAWVVPMANQAFRVSIVGHPLAKGSRELTLGELRTALDTPTPERAAAAPLYTHVLALEYHKRWALGSAPVTLAFFAVALTYRRQWGRIMLLLAGSFSIVGYYVVMFSAMTLRLHHTSAFAAAWMPNITFLIVSLTIMKLTSKRTNGHPA